MSFTDPRDGDLEDDASSTSRHSLLGHASRMLLEISLPKLALAAIMLLVVPALLIGAAPKLVLWMTETAWRGVARFGLILALASFALIAGVVAWRWGRTLFRVVERNFWALNAGLVQPLYTALREATRLALESAAPGRSLAATRRDAGLAAGALIAAAGGVRRLVGRPAADAARRGVRRGRPGGRRTRCHPQRRLGHRRLSDGGRASLEHRRGAVRNAAGHRPVRCRRATLARRASVGHPHRG